MYGLLNQIVDQNGNVLKKDVSLDFGDLSFIEPVGVVVLSNLIEYITLHGGICSFNGLFITSKAVLYLDDSGFFRRYLSKPLREHASARIGTLPLTLVANPEAIGFLYQTMIPWLAARMSSTEHSFGVVRVSLEEIFHNINDHSGVGVGCVHAQYFPMGRDIQIAISDFGIGIPQRIRTVRPGIDDASALRLACEEGFTTRSNVRNRGAGLATLIRYVTAQDRGHVWIVSGKANLSAVHRDGASKVTARTTSGVYPGTMVRLTLKEDSIEKLAMELEQEEFAW